MRATKMYFEKIQLYQAEVSIKNELILNSIETGDVNPNDPGNPLPPKK